MFQEAPEAQLHRGVNRHSDRGDAPDPGLLSQQRLAGGGGGNGCPRGMGPVIPVLRSNV